MPIHWNHAAALQRVDGDAALLGELIGIFFQDCPNQIDNLMQSLARQDCALLRQTAHTLKGSLGYLGACEAEELAREIERAGRDADLARAEQLVAGLRAHIEMLRPVMLSGELACVGASN
jgi:HPt (histidine-containing phosphotransfer) domain-containing protein